MPRIAEVAFPVPLPKGFHYLVPEGMRVEPGMRVRAPFGPRFAQGLALSVFDGEPDRPLKALGSLMDSQPALDAELLECAKWLARTLAAPIGECVKAVLPSFVKSLSEEASFPPPARLERPSPAFELTPGQANALKAMFERLEARRHHAVLLYGVPASGKTEVYLRLIRKAVEGGGQALFLLPEISLTQPFFEEFAASLDVPVVLWHSRLGAKARRQAWLGLRRGEVKVVVGARSAALLPLPNLRVAVLDEEQDESFKQEGQSPLYHAREVALHRAEKAGALAVLGSATPSLEAWQMAKSGRAELLAMPDRVSAVARPSVQVLEPPPYGGCLSDPLVEKLKQTLRRGEQSILLVNRRGFSTLVMCRKCGWVDRCVDCGVAKIQHLDQQETAPDGQPVFVMRCHHCERTWRVADKCAKCGNAGVRVSGVGTQKVVAEVKRAIPGARVLRMDGDTVGKTKAKDEKLYQRFLAKQADILVGTKLVAKSFHFPDVTLVGVVDADTMLHMPDFRASERTMQLLAQVAGRSGRAEKPGEVVLQTLHAAHAAIAKTVEGDYGGFADGELAARRDLRYPPFAALVRLLWLGKNEQAAAEAAQASCERLRAELGPSGHELVGPAPAVLKTVGGQFRFHALLKSPPERLEPALDAARACPLPSTVKLKVNVDPYDLF